MQVQVQPDVLLVPVIVLGLEQVHAASLAMVPVLAAGLAEAEFHLAEDARLAHHLAAVQVEVHDPADHAVHAVHPASPLASALHSDQSPSQGSSAVPNSAQVSPQKRA